MFPSSGHLNSYEFSYETLTSSKTTEVDHVSIVRIGLAETEKFSEGYDAIFGRKQRPAGVKPKKAAKKTGAAKAKAGPKKKKKK